MTKTLFLKFWMYRFAANVPADTIPAVLYVCCLGKSWSSVHACLCTTGQYWIGIDIFEMASLASMMKLFGFPFILHGWYQFRPWTIIGKSSWCIILEFESKHVITGWQSLLVKTFTTASDFRGNLGEEFLPTAHWCNELMIHDYS